MANVRTSLPHSNKNISIEHDLHYVLPHHRIWVDDLFFVFSKFCYFVSIFNEYWTEIKFTICFWKTCIYIITKYIIHNLNSDCFCFWLIRYDGTFKVHWQREIALYDSMTDILDILVFSAGGRYHSSSS